MIQREQIILIPKSLKELTHNQKISFLKMIETLNSIKLDRRFENTLKYAGQSYFQSILKESILFVLFESFLSLYRGIEGNNLNHAITSFLNDRELVEEFKSNFIEANYEVVMLKFLESFLTGEYGAKLRFDRTVFFQHGWSLETFVYMYILPYFLINFIVASSFDADQINFFQTLNFKEFNDHLVSLHNGFPLKSIGSNDRIFDIIFAILSNSEGYFNIECKSAREGVDITKAIESIIPDTFSSILFVLLDALRSNSPNIGKQQEVQVLPVDDNLLENSGKDDLNDIMSYLLQMQNILDLISPYETLKYNRNQLKSSYIKHSKAPKKIQFYLEVINYLNKKINEDSVPKVKIDAIKKIVGLFNSEEFKNEVWENFGRKYYFSSTTKGQYSLRFERQWRILYDLFGKRIFLTDLNQYELLDILIQKNENDNFFINWNVLLNIQVTTSKILQKDFLENIEFALIEEKDKLIEKKITDLNDKSIKRRWIIIYKIYRNDDGKIEKIRNGIASFDDNELVLPEDYESGYFDANRGKVVGGTFFLTNKKGILLDGRVYLDPNSGKLAMKSNIELIEMLKAKIEKVKSIFSIAHINHIYLNTYLRSISWKAGRKITAILQEVKSHIIPMGRSKSFISGPTVSERWRQLKLKGFQVDEGRYEKARVKEMINAINRVLLQMFGILGSTHPHKRSVISFTKNFWNLFSDEERYSM
jgi:hypothetical protein